MTDMNNIESLVVPKSYIIEQMNTVCDSGIPDGLRTGVSCLDNLVRLQLGAFVVITGYSGVGKSEFIDWLCYRYNIKYGYKTLVYSPENSIQQHLPKLISKFTGKAFNNLVPADRENALWYVCDNFLFIDTNQGKPIEQIISETEKYIIEENIKILVFEPYNSFMTQMSDGDVFNLNTIRLILTKLRDLAVKHNVLVIMSAHPKKPNDSKPPTAYDIAHSADFKNRADYNITIHRNKGAKVQIVVDKVRDKNFGICDKCNLLYDMDSGNYYNSDDYRDSEYIHEAIEFQKL